MSSKTYEPSDKGKEAVLSAIGAIEGCSPQDRGYVLNRLAQVYFGARSSKVIREALKQSKAKATKKPKLSWKRQWEATPEYQAWQSHIATHRGESPEQRLAHKQTYEGLRACAFRVRDAIKSSPDHRGSDHDNEGER